MMKEMKTVEVGEVCAPVPGKGKATEGGGTCEESQINPFFTLSKGCHTGCCLGAARHQQAPSTQTAHRQE